MVGNWLVVLPLLVDLKAVTLQPITEEKNARQIRQLDLGECCPCPDAGLTRNDEFTTSSVVSGRDDCPCQSRAKDAETSASILLPALKAIQPFVKQTSQKTEPKPLLQPEVGLASSVLETLREVTDEEYQDALARDAARSAVKLFESDLSVLDDPFTESPKNIVRIFLNPRNDMEDNLPEPSHIQETRCIHSPLESIHDVGELRISRPSPIIEMDVPRRTMKNLKKNKNLLHRNDMDHSVGASNIQERIMEPSTDDNLQDIDLNQPQTTKLYPTLFGLLPPNNKIESDDPQQSIVNTLNIEPTVKPKMNVKLRDLIENLDTLKKERTKLPVIDLKKYFATTTRLPPLKLNPLFRNNRPSPLKDLLKLKDVELIPRNNFGENTLKTDKSILNSQNLKLQNINCDDDHDAYVASSINKDITTMSKPPMLDAINTDPVDTVSKIDSKIVFDQKNYKQNIHKTIIEDHDPTRYFNSNQKTSLSKPTDLQSPYSFNIDNTGSGEGLNTEDLLIQNDKIKRNHTECFSPNKDFIKQGFNGDALEKGFELSFNDNKDTSDEEPTKNEYQLEFVEDLNLPIEFDNSSIIPEMDLKDTNSQDTKENLIKQDILDDPTAAASNDDSEIIKKSNETRTKPEILFKDNFANFVSNDNLSQVCKHLFDENNQGLMNISDEDNTIMASNDGKTGNSEESWQSHDLSITEEVQEKHGMKEVPPEDIPNISSINSHNADLKDDSSQISFQDLQDMSDFILNLSDSRKLSNEIDSNEIINSNEDLNEIQIEDVEMSNPVLPLSMLQENNSQDKIISKDKNFAENRKATLGSSKKDSCISPITFDTIDNINAVSNNIEVLDKTHNEMTAQASEPKPSSITFTNFKSVEPETLLLRNTADDTTNDNGVTTPAASINDIFQVNKNSKFFDDIKLKLDNLLFSTTERVFSHLEDNVNESSNDKPTKIHANKFKSSDKLQRIPQKKLQETILPQIPGLSNSFKRKLPLPKSLDETINFKPKLNRHIDLLLPVDRQDNQKERKHNSFHLKEPLVLKKSQQNPLNNNKFRSPLKSNTHNILKSPLDLSWPLEDILEPHSALTDLSNRLRSHTEDSIQTLKESLESRLKESQTSGLLTPSQTMDTQDIFESITNRRDELNDKLYAIHSDINDRFSSFQQSILDQLNLPTSVRNSEYDENSSDLGFRLNSMQSTRSETLKPRLRTSEQNPDVNETREKLFKSSKALPRFKNTDLSQNPSDHWHGILQKKGLPSFNDNLLKINLQGDNKISLHKPLYSATTEKASLIPRPKTFRSRVDIAPKIYTDREAKMTEAKPLVRVPVRADNISEELESSPSRTLPFKTNLSRKQSKTITEHTSTDEGSSTDSPLDKLRKTLLLRNQDMKSKSNLKRTSNKIKIPSSVLNAEDDNQQNTVLSRVRDGKTKVGPKRTDALARSNSNSDKINHISNIDTTHAAAEHVERLKLVEPLKENVPYKCKLICYRDV